MQNPHSNTRPSRPACSPHGAKRNAGFARTGNETRIVLRSIRATLASSCAGLTRASMRHARGMRRFTMDCRVRPGNDAGLALVG